jgi:hypothetical protein
MAGLPIINGIQRVALLWKFGNTGQMAVNVMHFSTASTDTLALKNALDTNVTANMWLQTRTDAQITQLSITPLDGTSATQIYAVSGTKWAGPGATTADIMPQVTAVLSLRTSQRGRQNRGRLYLPWVTEDKAQSGAYTATFGTQQTAWDTFRTAMATALMPMHVASYGHSLHKHKDPNSGTITYTPVTWTPHSNAVVTGTIEAMLATMRPRQSRLR